MEQKIRYDKWMVKFVFGLAITFTIIVLSSVPFLFMTASQMPAYDWLDVYEVIAVLSFWPMVLFWLIFLDGSLYLRDLKKAGFDLPNHRRDYQNQLGNLPRSNASGLDAIERDRQNVILASLSFLGALFFGFLSSKFFLQWGFLENDSGFVGGSLVLLAFFWLIGFFTYLRRTNNLRYRNFYEPTDGRKLRKPFGQGLITIIVCFILSLILSNMPFSMTEYIAKSRLLIDEDLLRELLIQMEQFYEESGKDNFAEWSDSYQKLSKGVSMFEADWERDLLYETVFETEEGNRLEEVKAGLRMKNPSVTVKMVDGKIEAFYSYTWEYKKSTTIQIMFLDDKTVQLPSSSQKQN